MSGRKNIKEMRKIDIFGEEKAKMEDERDGLKLMGCLLGRPKFISKPIGFFFFFSLFNEN